MSEPAMMSIGEFAALTRLSPKALRLYAELDLLTPARVDPDTGYRWYAPAQAERARVIALLRHLDMPLARIRRVLDRPGPEAADDVRAYWSGVTDRVRAQALTVDHVVRHLHGGTAMTSPDSDTAAFAVAINHIGERAVLGAVRHVHEAEAGATMGALLARMRTAGPGLPGLDGCPYAVYHGAVTADSDGPVEIVRPVADLAAAQAAATRLGDVQARIEAGHDEAAVVLTLPQAAWPAHLAALDAIAGHLTEHGRTQSGPPRQIMIADWRTVGPDQPACLLAVPLS